MLMRPLAFVLLAAVALASAAAERAGAVTFSACRASVGFSCASLTVPLERRGPVSGTITLNLERLQAAAAPSSSAVLALAGGPGQPATPLAGFFAKAVAPALASRDLLVYDQRGTGRSHPLQCRALNDSSASESAVAKLIARCAAELGAERGAFTSEESVEDIEAIRKALGYEKLVLYGTSYGTKVAELYAARYPGNVEALLLDSVVPVDGPEPFPLATLQAIGPALQEICAQGACRGITASPSADLAQLAAQLRRQRLSGSVYDGSGHRHRASLGQADVLDILLAGDLNPALRALFPAAVLSAEHHDPDPLLRLDALSRGLIPNLPSHGPEQLSPQADNQVLFLATSCEEIAFPWQRAAGAAVRKAEALAVLHGMPSAQLYPFDANTVWQDSLSPYCVAWPNAAPPPSAAAALPNVPTLILSGAQDLRTPSSGAHQLAGLIPDAQLQTVPYTGHSVLGSDFSKCSADSVQEFFSSQTVRPCAATTNLFAPTPITPRTLRSISPLPGLAGRRGRTVTAILQTMLDLSRQVIGATLQLQRELPSGSGFGGLHGGYARLSATLVRLHRFTFVEGVELTGAFKLHNGQLQPAQIRITGSAAAHGWVRLDAGRRVSGVLDGRRFSVNLARLAANNGRAWPSRPPRFPSPALHAIR